MVKTRFYETGIYQMDYVCAGGRGIPSGSMIEITSDAGLGKTTLTLDCIRRILETNEDACGLYIDAEQGLNEMILDNLNLTQYLGDLLEGGRLQVEYWNNHYQLDDELFRPVTKKDKGGLIVRMGNNLKFIVVDSITAVLPKQVLEGNIENARPGIKAQYDSSLLLKFKAVTKPLGITSFWINQQRWKFNFKNPKLTRLMSSGGKAFEFYTDIRLELKKRYPSSKILKQVTSLEGVAEGQVGLYVMIKSFKNKYTKPDVSYTLPVIFGKGISNILSYDVLLEASGHKKVSGGWVTLVVDGEEICKVHGIQAFENWISDHYDYVKELVDKNMEKYIEEHRGIDI